MPASRRDRDHHHVSMRRHRDRHHVSMHTNYRLFVLTESDALIPILSAGKHYRSNSALLVTGVVGAAIVTGKTGPSARRTIQKEFRS